MGKITVHQAAKQGWPTRPTLYRAVKNGRLSAEKDGSGRTVLDTAELVRVFGEPVARQERKQERETAGDGDGAQIAWLKAELDRARAERDREREQERAERDRLLSIIDRLALPPPPARPWWRRLVGA